MIYCYVPIYLHVSDKLHSCQMSLEMSMHKGVHHKTKASSRKETVDTFIWDSGMLLYTRNNIATPELIIEGINNAVGMLNVITDLAMDMFMRGSFSNASCLY